jgi:hypothetical protein
MVWFWNIVYIITIIIGAYVLFRIILFKMRLIYAIVQGRHRVYLRVSIARREARKDREEQTHKTFKEVIGVMEQLYRSFYELSELDLMNLIHTKVWNYDNISFEIVCRNKQVFFYVVTQRRHLALVQKQLTSYYEDIDIEEVEPYDVWPEGNAFRSYYMYLLRKFWYPIKTYKTLENDPLNDLTNVFSGLEEDEIAAIQVVMDPTNTKRWNKKAAHMAAMRFKGRNVPHWVMNNFFTRILGALFFGLTRGETPTEAPGASVGDHYLRMVQSEEEIWKAVGVKSRQPFFHTTVRIAASAKDKKRVIEILNSVMISFNCFMDEGLNWFQARRIIFIDWFNNKIMHFTYNLRLNAYLGEKPSLMSPEELASVYHFPNAIYNTSPVISWLTYKVLPVPPDLPKDGLLLGHNHYRGAHKEVHIDEKDRSRHMYVIGKSGTGKSAFLSFLARQDALNGNGFCLVDPHGDLVEDVLAYVPDDRIKDVVVFNPGDHTRPLALNLLEASSPEQMDMASSQATEIFIKIFGNEIFGPRIQHYFRNGCLTLMENPEEGATLIDVPRLFVDEKFRNWRTARLKNPVVRSFWEHEYISTAERERKEIIPYFTAKFGPFITNTIMRNIIGQKTSSFELRDLMDNGKILLINLSKGDIGAINTQLLGLVVVSKIQMAALSRTNIPESKRRQFYLYIDEFQNFATDSLCSILSEARKYRLSLIMAHQYLQQITEENTTSIRDAVFGNVGTMMAFRIGAEDSEYMAKEFAPVLSEQDLVNIARFKAYIKMNIDDTTSRPFSMGTIWDETGKDLERANFLRRYSRLKYGRKRKVVNYEVANRIGLG